MNLIVKMKIFDIIDVKNVNLYSEVSNIVRRIAYVDSISMDYFNCLLFATVF